MNWPANPVMEMRILSAASADVSKRKIASRVTKSFFIVRLFQSEIAISNGIEDGDDDLTLAAFV